MLVVMRHDDGLRRIERGVENAIRDAIDGGELRDLPGAGAPLPRDADVRRELGDAVADLNRHIDRYNRLVPVPNLQLSFAGVERIFELAAED